jgi:hypothetical protein
VLLDGTLVTDWTTVSGSGFHYGSATVIPVPAAFWLFSSALLGLAGLRRRKPPYQNGVSTCESTWWIHRC